MRKSPPTGERGGASAAPLLCPLLSSTPLLHSHIDTSTIIQFLSYFKFVHVSVCLLLYSWILWWLSVLCLTELTKLTTYLLQLLLKKQTQKLNFDKHIGYRTDLQDRCVWSRLEGQHQTLKVQGALVAAVSCVLQLALQLSISLLNVIQLQQRTRKPGPQLTHHPLNLNTTQRLSKNNILPI